jgi:hypothetical protein
MAKATPELSFRDVRVPIEFALQTCSLEDIQFPSVDDNTIGWNEHVIGFGDLL